MELHRKNISIKKRMTQWHVKPKVPTTTDKLKSQAASMGKGAAHLIKEVHKVATSDKAKKLSNNVTNFFKNYNRRR